MILAPQNNSPISNLPIYRYSAVHTPGTGRYSFVQIYFKKCTRFNLSSGEAASRARGHPAPIAHSSDMNRWSCCPHPLAEPTSSRHRLCRRPESPALQIQESLENNSGVIARAAFVCPWRSPRKPVLPSQRIHPPRLRKPDSNSSDQNWFVFLLFLKSPQINLSNLTLIFPDHSTFNYLITQLPNFQPFPLLTK